MGLERIMKKNILLLVLISVFLLAPAMSVVVASTPIIPLPDVDFMRALSWIVQFVFFIFMTVAVIFIIVAAFQFLTAAGDAEAIKKARTSILYAVIAIVVAVMAYGTVGFIKDRLVAAPPVPPPAPTTPPATLAPPVEPVEPVEPVV